MQDTDTALSATVDAESDACDLSYAGKTFGHLLVLVEPFTIGNGQFVRARCSKCEAASMKRVDEIEAGDYACTLCNAAPKQKADNQLKPPTGKWQINGPNNTVYTKRQFASHTGLSLYAIGRAFRDNRQLTHGDVVYTLAD